MKCYTHSSFPSIPDSINLAQNFVRAAKRSMPSVKPMVVFVASFLNQRLSYILLNIPPHKFWNSHKQSLVSSTQNHIKVNRTHHAENIKEPTKHWYTKYWM